MLETGLILDEIVSQTKFSSTKQDVLSFFLNDVQHSPIVSLFQFTFVLNIKPLQECKITNTVIPVFVFLCASQFIWGKCKI